MVKREFGDECYWFLPAHNLPGDYAYRASSGPWNWMLEIRSQTDSAGFRFKLLPATPFVAALGTKSRLKKQLEAVHENDVIGFVSSKSR